MHFFQGTVALTVLKMVARNIYALKYYYYFTYALKYVTQYFKANLFLAPMYIFTKYFSYLKNALISNLKCCLNFVCCVFSSR